MSDKQTPENAVDYKATLNLPDTEFAMKANLAVREAKWLEEWYADNIYQQIRASRIGKKKYVLHDGPPYANGQIHLGHHYQKPSYGWLRCTLCAGLGLSRFTHRTESRRKSR